MADVKFFESKFCEFWIYIDGFKNGIVSETVI